MSMQVNRNSYENKPEILTYLRERATESYGLIRTKYGESEYKKRANAINIAIKESARSLIKIAHQRASHQGWSKTELLNNILMLNYCSYIVMIEFRNHSWPYEYMAFSRRIGELWEPFCKLCFDDPVNESIELYEPPSFSDVRKALQREISDYINQLPLEDDQKKQLNEYYEKVWSLVTSGEIALELDLHFKLEDIFYNIDFKSGFQSNEKGNTNRLLLVASIYKNIVSANNECLIFVRAPEEENNHYLQTLKKSGIWEVYCGDETYQKIHEFSGFDLASWIDEHMSWGDDLSSDVMDFFTRNDLVKYLTW